jgi:predicted PurR-regulated permease PerM
MVIKTIFSLITGLLVSLMLWILGVHYALLWGMLAFLLNFIPNIGSIIAAIPVVLLSLVQMGSTTALIVGIGFIIINILIGSVIEPKYMGDGLGLSILVVFVSLIFWGWIFGPIGMLLSIPLTVMIKIATESNEKTQWIAVLLDSKEPQ